MSKTEIGVMAHNEAGNLSPLLSRLLDEPGEHRICVVSSGSTDGTNKIAQQYALNHDRVRVILESVRNGKARAINRFLASLSPETNRVVIISGDVIPAPGALSALIAPLDSTDIQMTGARPCPINPNKGLVNCVVRFQWNLLDRVARNNPKLGEMIAFRPPIEPIDPDTVVDEAALEAQLTANAGTLAYVPTAIVHNSGPQTMSDLIAQRERIWVGHLRLHQRTGYRVSTFRLRDLFACTIKHLIAQPQELPIACCAGTIELFSRFRGTYRYKVRGELPTIWPPLLSAKIR